MLGRLGVPRPVRELILLIYRLIFVFLERAAVGRQAQVARLGYDGPRRSIRSLGWLAGSLFQRSLDRGRRLETGLAARGFTGDLPQLGSDRAASGGWLIAGALLPVAVVAVSIAWISENAAYKCHCGDRTYGHGWHSSGGGSRALRLSRRGRSVARDRSDGAAGAQSGAAGAERLRQDHAVPALERDIEAARRAGSAGRDPGRYDRRGLRDWRSRVGLVLQDPDDQIFAATVERDVAFGPLNLGLGPAEARERVGSALEALGIADLGRPADAHAELRPEAPGRHCGGAGDAAGSAAAG